MSVWINPEIQSGFHGPGSGTTHRCLEASLLDPHGPGARLMEAMEDIDRPFVRGGRGELAGKSTAVGGGDKGDRSALVRVTTQG